MDEPLRPVDVPPEVVIVDDLCINIKERYAQVGETKLRLEPRELDVLIILALSFHARPSQPVHRDFFLECFHPQRDWLDTKVIDVYVCKLRKVMAYLSGGKNYIYTVWGKGYKLSAPQPARTQCP